MDILIDFDGTCVTHEYPNVGKDVGAVPVLKKLNEHGHNLILFTMRSDKRGISPVTGKEQDGGLQDAVDWFKENKVKLYGIQKNPTQHEWTSSPKAYGQLIIDDICLGIPLTYDKLYSARPFVDWVKVESMLFEMGILN